MLNEERQFQVYAVPYRKPFVVAKDKVEVFKSQKQSKSIDSEI